MLSLRLKSGEYLAIGDEIAVQIFRQTGDSFEVAVKAPREIPVLRGEVFERSSKRPAGLREYRQKTPSELRSRAKRLSAWTKRQEQREAQLALVHEMLEIVERLNKKTTTDLDDIAGLQSLLEQLEGELQHGDLASQAPS